MFYFGLALFVAAMAAVLFARADARMLATGIRIAGPVVLGFAGLVLMAVGRASLGGMLIAGASAWYGAVQMRRQRQPQRTPGRRSTVRTAALEMELDHDTGALNGLVLAGGHEGKELNALGLPDILGLRQELAADGESLQLLETYLDGRFPAWRENLKTDGGDRQGSAPASGPMTEQEAYKVLGLEAGASAADIRKAHRRLMQRLHPDLGGSSFLAARINEAKDILLSMHK
jgi:hypothetical protein